MSHGPRRGPIDNDAGNEETAPTREGKDKISEPWTAHRIGTDQATPPNPATGNRSDLDYLLRLADVGGRFFACRADKTPGWRNGARGATTDPAAITRLVAAYNEGTVAAIGMTGIVVIDLDRHHEHQDGVAAWNKHPTIRYYRCTVADLAAAGFGIHRTPRNGVHIVVPTDGLAVGTSLTGILDGVDTRADGGYVIVVGDGYSVQQETNIDVLRPRYTSKSGEIRRRGTTPALNRLVGLVTELSGRDDFWSPAPSGGRVEHGAPVAATPSPTDAINEAHQSIVANTTVGMRRKVAYTIGCRYAYAAGADGTITTITDATAQVAHFVALFAEPDHHRAFVEGIESKWGQPWEPPRQPTAAASHMNVDALRTILDDDFSGAQRRVGHAIADAIENGCFASRRWIAHRCNVSEDTARRHTRELIADQVITAICDSDDDRPTGRYALAFNTSPNSPVRAAAQGVGRKRETDAPGPLHDLFAHRGGLGADGPQRLAVLAATGIGVTVSESARRCGCSHPAATRIHDALAAVGIAEPGVPFELADSDFDAMAVHLGVAGTRASRLGGWRIARAAADRINGVKAATYQPRREPESPRRLGVVDDDGRIRTRQEKLVSRKRTATSRVIGDTDGARHIEFTVVDTITGEIVRHRFRQRPDPTARNARSQ